MSLDKHIYTYSSYLLLWFCHKKLAVFIDINILHHSSSRKMRSHVTCCCKHSKQHFLFSAERYQLASIQGHTSDPCEDNFDLRCHLAVDLYTCGSSSLSAGLRSPHGRSSRCVVRGDPLAVSPARPDDGRISAFE